MNDKIENLLKEKCENPNMLDYFVLYGSRLYGINRENSDWDYRGVLHQVPIEYLLGLKKFECYEKPDADYKIYSIKRFISLALRGSPEHIELLFIPEDKIIQCSKYMREILDRKDFLLSNRIYHSIIGYGKNEFRKALGVKYIIDKIKKDEDSIINDIRNLFHPDKLDMDNIIEILFKNKERKLVSSRQGIGKKRLMEFKKYSFGTSCASHSIRLLGELLEIMETGKIVFPRPNANVLKGIRLGKFSKDEVIEMHDDLLSKVEKMKDKSSLPDKPSEEIIWKVYKEILFSYLKNDKRSRELLDILYVEHI